MRQWQTVDEVALELRLRRDVVLRLLRQNILLGVRLAQGKNVQWRVYPPSARMKQLLLEREEHYLHVPLFSTAEVARVLKVKACTIRKLVEIGKLRPTLAGKGKPSFYAAAEVRRFLWQRERKHRRGKKFFSPWLVDFLRSALAEDEEPSVQQLERLVAHVMAYLPEEERLPLMATFWKHLGGINEILRRVRDARS